MHFHSNNKEIVGRVATQAIEVNKTELEANSCSFPYCSLIIETKAAVGVAASTTKTGTKY